MSLLNQTDFTEFSKSTIFTPSVIPDGITEYYYDSFSDYYYYNKETNFTTKDLKIAQAYQMKPGFTVDVYGDEFEISGEEKIKPTDSVIIDKITELFNKQIDYWKQKKATSNKDNKQVEWDKVEKIYFENAASGWNYDKYKTEFKYLDKKINKTLFIIPDTKRVIFLNDQGLVIRVMEKTPGVSDGIWNLLKQRVDEYKKTIDENKKTIKQKQLDKLDKTKEKPNEIEKKNIEDAPNKKELQTEIKSESDANKKAVDDAKPKLVIKIPKPFAKGYFIIDLSNLLKALLGLLSGLALSLLMSLIGKLLSGLLSFDLHSGKKINAGKITTAVNSLNVSSLIEQVLLEEELLNINTELNNVDKKVVSVDNNLSIEQTQNPDDVVYNTQSNLDNTGTYSSDVVDVKLDKVIQPPTENKLKIIPVKEIYTVNKRNRTDLLSSVEVNDRLTNKSNKRIVDNKNYGKYW